MSSRRQFISLLGGAAAAWPVAARGQQAGRVRRIGRASWLRADARSAIESAWLYSARACARSGWVEGRNVQIEFALGAAHQDRLRRV